MSKKHIKKQIQQQTKQYKKDGSFHLEFLNSEQKQAFDLYQKNDVTFLLGPAGSGKTHLAAGFGIANILTKEKAKLILSRPIVEAGEKLGYLPGPQPLDAKVLTPSGWKTMGEIKENDFVIGRDGNPSRVLKIFPQGKRMVYKILTTDGTSTEACLNHIWYTETLEDKKRKRKGCIKTTKEIMDSLKNNKNKINHFLPRNEAVKFDKKHLPLSPYTMGVILGDGCIGNSVSFANMDVELINKVSEEIKLLNCELTNNSKNITYNIKGNLKFKKTAKIVCLTNIKTNEVFKYESVGIASKIKNINKSTLGNRCKNNIVIDNFKYEFLPSNKRWTNPVKDILFNLGLENKKAKDKFVPDIYKFSSIEDRLEILRGILDTDGTVKKSGSVTFTTISKKLALDVCDIVRSLGGKATINIRDRRNKKNCFIKNRKIQARHISYSVYINLPENMNPFYITRKSNRFSCKYMHHVGIKSIEPICEKEVKCILIDSPEHLYLTDNFIVTHNTFEEKIAPYLIPLMHCFDDLVGKDSLNREFLNKNLEFLPIAYCRGVTFKNCVAILDEAQNATKAQIKLFLTRLGMNAKIVITGDPFQTDIGSNSGLMEIVNSLKDVNGIGIMQFTEKAIVRHPLIPEILKKI